MALETVTSPLLSDPPPAPAEKTDRPVDEDYAASEAAGYVESFKDYDARMTLRWAVALNLGAGLIFAAIALTGRRYLRGTR